MTPMKEDLIRNEYLPFTNKTANQRRLVSLSNLLSLFAKNRIVANKEFLMKNVLINSFMICILIGCSKQEPRYYFWVDYSYDGQQGDENDELIICLKDVNVKYKVVNNKLYVEDLEKACDNCC